MEEAVPETGTCLGDCGFVGDEGLKRWLRKEVVFAPTPVAFGGDRARSFSSGHGGNCKERERERERDLVCGCLTCEELISETENDRC